MDSKQVPPPRLPELALNRCFPQPADGLLVIRLSTRQHARLQAALDPGSSRPGFQELALSRCRHSPSAKAVFFVCQSLEITLIL